MSIRRQMKASPYARKQALIRLGVTGGVIAAFVVAAVAIWLTR